MVEMLQLQTHCWQAHFEPSLERTVTVYFGVKTLFALLQREKDSWILNR